MWGALKSSTRILTPSCSTISSPGRTMSSKAIPYWRPEQPPPDTKTRSPSSGLPSFSSRPLRCVSASELSETVSCSIIPGCETSLRVRGFRVYHALEECPPRLSRIRACRGGGLPRQAGGASAPLQPRYDLSSDLDVEAELPREAAGTPALVGLEAGDDPGQLLGAAGDRAARVGEDQDLALDRGLVGLGAVVADLDVDRLLERALHVLAADHGLGGLVVHGDDDPPGHDLEDGGEDVEQVADVLQRGELGRGQQDDPLRMLEHGQRVLVELYAEVEEDVAEGVAEQAHRLP